MTEFVLSEIVNSLINSDGTLTISPTVGNVVASIDLSTKNMWLAAVNSDTSFGAFVLSTDNDPGVIVTTTSLIGGEVNFGPGGSSAPNVSLQYGGAAGNLYLTPLTLTTEARLTIFGTTTAADSLNSVLQIYGLPGHNGEWLEIDGYLQDYYSIGPLQSNSGSLRPLLFQMGSSAVATITTTPTFQLNKTMDANSQTIENVDTVNLVSAGTLNWNADVSIGRQNAGGVYVESLVDTDYTGFYILPPSGVTPAGNVSQFTMAAAANSATQLFQILMNTSANQILFQSGSNNGTYWPLVFTINGGTEAFRLQTSPPYFKENEDTTGAKTATLGTNGPMVTTTPYTWWKLASSDGSTVYIPMWK